jgi:hypothetical protein
MNRSTRSHIRTDSLAVTGLLGLAAGCASAPGSQRPTQSAEIATSSAALRSNHISAVELQNTNAVSTLDAVRRLHPEFLRSSARAAGPSESAGPSVYVGTTYAGDVSWLASIPLVEVRDISFLHPVEARMKLGANCACAGGVIVVQTETHRLP